MISREEAKEVAQEVVAACRMQVDAEIDRLRDGVWTEERAKKLAQEAGEIAADIAVRKITDNFYMSIGKKTVTTIGATVVVIGIWFKEELKSWATGKR